MDLYQDPKLVSHDDDRPIHLFEDILFLGKKVSSCCILVWNLLLFEILHTRLAERGTSIIA